MRPMSTALIIRIRIRDRLVLAGIIITNEVIPIGNLAARPKASSQIRMGVVNSRVDNGDFNTRARVALFVQFVHSRHCMD